MVTKKNAACFLHRKKRILIDKTHLQKHIETLEDTAYVHDVCYLGSNCLHETNIDIYQKEWGGGGGKKVEGGKAFKTVVIFLIIHICLSQ